VRTVSCRARTPAGSIASIRGATPEAPMTCSNAASAVMAGQGCSQQPHRVCLAARLQPGEQVAEPLADRMADRERHAPADG